MLSLFHTLHHHTHHGWRSASSHIPSLYNSLSKSVEALPPVHHTDSGKRRPLTWYSCGPTVYDDTHLGHARSYVSTDVLRRVLTNFFGYNVHFVLGMTDVDDKIIRRSTELGVSAQFLARKHEREFFEDLEALNCEAPNTVTRVTEHMSDIIQYIETILRHGNAYELNDGVYFDVGSLGDQYGKQLGTPDSRRLNGGDEGNASSSSASSASSKKDRRDFALWKKTAEEDTCVVVEGGGSDCVVAWDSPWGRGRPGWHIECSAMTNTVLGTSFDLHSGGIDLCFPHHCNEVAQANAFNQSDEWVSMFLHTGHLHIDGLKMSKSLKNFITVRQMLRARDSEWKGGKEKEEEDEDEDVDEDVDEDKDEDEDEEGKELVRLQTVLGGIDVGTAFRMFVLSHHYRSNITYSLDRMRDAAVDVKRFASFLMEMEAHVETQLKINSMRGMNDDVIDSSSGSDDEAMIQRQDTRRRAQHLFFTTLHDQVDQAIHDALANDMNTPQLLTTLRDMCSQIRTHVAKEKLDGIDVQVESLQNVCRTITLTFARLGLDVTSSSTSSSFSLNQVGTTRSDDREQEVVQAFATFRASVRDAARRKEGPGALFQLCDDVRNVVGPTIGWEFVDGDQGIENVMVRRK